MEEVQQKCSNQPHPLLAPELLKIKTSQELYGTVLLLPPSTLTSEASSSTAPSLPQDDRSLPSSVVALSLEPRTTVITTAADGAGGVRMTGNDASSASSAVVRREKTPPEVPPDILQLSSTFPFPWMVDLSIRKRIRDALPPREEAEMVCAEARNNALWQYVTITYLNQSSSSAALQLWAYALFTIYCFVPVLPLSLMDHADY